MNSSKDLQAILHATHMTASRNLTNLDAARASIYDLVMHAFISEVLTLARLNSVIQSVRDGINDFSTTKNSPTSFMLTMAQRSAYRGLYSAASEGLAASALAYSEFMKYSRFCVSKNFNKNMAYEVLQLKCQLDQITMLSGLQSNIGFQSVQMRYLQQLSIPIPANSTQDDKSVLSWPNQFFQICEFKAIKNSENLVAGSMLLGLFTSGVLAGMRSYATTASSGNSSI